MIWWNCGPEPADLLGADEATDALLGLVRDWFEQFADDTTSVAACTGHVARPDGGSDVRVRCRVRHHRPGEVVLPPSPQAVLEPPQELDLVIAVRALGEVPGAVCEALVADAPSTHLEVLLDPAAVPSDRARPAVVDVREHRPRRAVPARRGSRARS